MSSRKGAKNARIPEEVRSDLRGFGLVPAAEGAPVGRDREAERLWLMEDLGPKAA